jgi:hypothetical protein
MLGAVAARRGTHREFGVECDRVELWPKKVEGRSGIAAVYRRRRCDLYFGRLVVVPEVVLCRGRMGARQLHLVVLRIADQLNVVVWWIAGV